MKPLRNKVHLIGNISCDPEVRTLESGRRVARLSIAINETYKNHNGDRISETQFHNLVAWARTATIVEKFLKKGSEVAIEGKLINQTLTDKHGVKQYITEIEIIEFIMLAP